MQRMRRLVERGYRKAVRAATSRERVESVRPGLHPILLVALPVDPGRVRDAWRFVSELHIDPGDLTIISSMEASKWAPARFINRQEMLNPEQLNLIGLPRRRVLDRVWAESPNLAMDLNPTFSLPSAYIVGASPAEIRIGFRSKQAAPFFDLQVQAVPGAVDPYEPIRSYLIRAFPDLMPPPGL